MFTLLMGHKLIYRECQASLLSVGTRTTKLSRVGLTTSSQTQQVCRLGKLSTITNRGSITVTKTAKIGLVLLSSMSLHSTASVAQTLQTIHMFKQNTNGYHPLSGVTLNTDGNLYGTTYLGGNSDPNYCLSSTCGVAYKITIGSHTESTIHRFCSLPDCADGGLPSSSNGPVVAGGGVLYGTVYNGGPFELTPPSGTSKKWTEKLLSSPTGGDFLYSSIAYDDTAGFLYGTTYADGVKEAGTLFSINLSTSQYITIYSFNEPKTGGYPDGGLLLNGGILYGTTREGSENGAGTIFSFNPTTSSFKTLYRFCPKGNCSDGGEPIGPIVVQQGIIYGTASGATSSHGTVYAFNISTNKLSILYSFTNGADGGSPLGGVAFDNAGILYGTTSEGGVLSDGSTGSGTVFSLNPLQGTFTTLHTFTLGKDGGFPSSQLTYVGGVFYGTTPNGGACEGCGTVFKLTP